MKLLLIRIVIALALFCVLLKASRGESPKALDPADLVVHHAKIVMVDEKFGTAEAVAVKDGRIVAVGDDDAVFRWAGPKTRIIDADSHMVLPGLYDSHVHPLDASTSELAAPLPNLRSLKDVFAYIHERAAATPKGEWIVVRYAFPTRLDEARFPTKGELDEAAREHPVLFHAGPAGVVNSLGLKASDITRDTPNPPAGVVAKDATTGEPTGMLRNAFQLLKGLPRDAARLTADAKREALKKLFHLYNEQGLTSIGDRNADRATLDLYRDLHGRGELTVRVNVARSFDPSGTREEVVRRLDELPGKDGLGGPTGAGDDWVRVGPIKLFLDGGMLSGSAYMREPWPKGATYQIDGRGDYRDLLFIQPEQLRGGGRSGQASLADDRAHFRRRGDGRTVGRLRIRGPCDADQRPPLLRHARQLPVTARYYERCKTLGGVRPTGGRWRAAAWLWKDGDALENILGEKRMRWFQPYKTWLEYTTHRRRQRPLGQAGFAGGDETRGTQWLRPGM